MQTIHRPLFFIIFVKRPDRTKTEPNSLNRRNHLEKCQNEGLSDGKKRHRNGYYQQFEKFYDFIFILKKWLSIQNKLFLMQIFYDTPEARTLRVNIRTNYSSFVDLLNTDFFRYIYQNRRFLQWVLSVPFCHPCHCPLQTPDREKKCRNWKKRCRRCWKPSSTSGQTSVQISRCEWSGRHQVSRPRVFKENTGNAN